MDIRIESDLVRQIRAFTMAERTRLPRVLSNAAGDTAAKTADAVKARLPSVFDAPVPFTARGIRFTRGRFSSTSGACEATVYIMPLQARYLRWQIEGGVRRGDPAKGGRVLVPYLSVARAMGQINSYGNVPRRATQRLPRRHGYVNNPTGREPGIYVRQGLALKPVLLWRKEQRVRPHFPFYAMVASLAPAIFNPALRAQLAQVRAR